MCRRCKTVYFPVLLCCLMGLLLLKNPQQAVQGFEDGIFLCTGTVLPALFPFFVLTDMLLSCPFREKTFRPAARILGLQSSIAGLAVLLSWLGGYAVCAQLVGTLRRSDELGERDAALVLLLGCCSSPGFVIGCVGGLLLGNLRLGVLLYVLQLAANLLAAAFCMPLLPRKEPLAMVTANKQDKKRSLPSSISKAVSSSLQVCGCLLFFRTISAVLVPLLPDMAIVPPVVSACMEISAGCADFAALGGRLALYGCCACLSLLGFSVWMQISMLVQGAVPMRILLTHRVIHFFLFLALVWLSARFLPGTVAVYRSMASRVIPTQRLPWDAVIFVFLFLCASLYKVRQNFYNK